MVSRVAPRPTADGGVPLDAQLRGCSGTGPPPARRRGAPLGRGRPRLAEDFAASAAPAGVAGFARAGAPSRAPRARFRGAAGCARRRRSRRDTAPAGTASSSGLRRRPLLHRLKLLERGVDAARSSAAARASCAPAPAGPARSLGVAIADEVAAVLAQDVDHRRVGIPAERRSRRSCSRRRCSLRSR